VRSTSKTSGVLGLPEERRSRYREACITASAYTASATGRKPSPGPARNQSCSRNPNAAGARTAAQAEAAAGAEAAAENRCRVPRPRAAAENRCRVPRPRAAPENRCRVPQPRAAAENRCRVPRPRAATENRCRVPQPRAAPGTVTEARGRNRNPSRRQGEVLPEADGIRYSGVT